MNLMNKLVEVVLMPLAEVNERLYGLIRICRCILLSTFLNDLDKWLVSCRLVWRTSTDLDHIIKKDRKISNAVVNIGGLVDPNKRLVEDGEEISE